MASSISATNTAAVLLEARSRSKLMAAIAMHNIANVATPRAADRDWIRGCSEARTVPEPRSRVKPPASVGRSAGQLIIRSGLASCGAVRDGCDAIICLVTTLVRSDQPEDDLDRLRARIAELEAL